MSALFETDEIQLDVNRFRNQKKIHEIALLVFKHAEKRRAEYRLNEIQGLYSDSEFQLIKSSGPLTQIHFSKKYWSDFIPWYEWISEPHVLRLCAKECGLEIWQLGQLVADEFKPKNWQVFSWMALAYQLNQYGNKVVSVLDKYVAKHDEVLEKQRSSARNAGLASGQIRKEKSKLTPKLVSEQCQLLMATGTEERNVASRLANRYRVTAGYIRKLLKKANQ
jgi:hypothetical protein